MYPHIAGTVHMVGCMVGSQMGKVADITKLRGTQYFKRGEMVRENLKRARLDKGLTQQKIADKLGISLVYYQKIEQGSRTGDFYIWDQLEELTGIHQRKLREM